MSPRKDILTLLLLLATALLCYANTFHVPFVLDDITSIIGNRRIPAFAIVLKSRMTGDITFALNYFCHGWWLPGYHLVNLLLHCGNALLVYLLLRSLFRTPLLVAGSENPAAYPLALAAALLFVAHPLQTQAVTYLAQRVTLLTAFFYLAALLFYLRGRLATHFRHTFLLLTISVTLAALAMLSKENAVTLPALVLFTELTFFRGRLLTRSALILLYLLPFAALLVVIFLKPASAPDLLAAISRLSAEQGAPDRITYLLTQFPVIITYLRLFLLPVGQNLDHDVPLRTTFTDPAVSGACLLLVLMVLLGSMAWHRGRKSGTAAGGLTALAGFGVGWFFMTSGVESALIPLRDVMSEQRLYLPSAGLVMTTAAALWLLLAKYSPAGDICGRFSVIMLTVVLALGGATFARNRVWRSEVALWQDVIVKSPGKGRGYGALGHAYQRAGLLNEAERSYVQAVRLGPTDHIARHNLGALYLQQKQYAAAAAELDRAADLSPATAVIRFNLGLAYTALGRLPEAEAAFAAAVRLQPDYPEAAANLAAIRKVSGSITAPSR